MSGRVRQIIGVGHAAGQHEAGKTLAGSTALQRPVGLEDVTLVEVVAALDLPGLGGDEHGRATGTFHGLPRLGQLDLLDAIVGDEEGDGALLRVASTSQLPSGVLLVLGFPTADALTPFPPPGKESGHRYPPKG